MEANSLLEGFGFFLLILIGVELMESIRAYMVEKVVHAEIVLKVGLFAVARKVIVRDVKTYSREIILGIAALIIAIVAAFCLVKITAAPRRTRS